MLNLGESGAGKTTAVVSLLAAGYNVRVIDLDRGMEALVNIISGDKSKYDKALLKNLHWTTLTETMRVTPIGQIVPLKASVWTRCTQILQNGKFNKTGNFEDCEADFGNLTKWTERDVLVIDTLGSLGTAAHHFHLQLQGALGQQRTQNEWRRDIGGAQSLLDTFLQMLQDDSIKCHIIINCHIVYAKEDGTMPKDGETNFTLKGFPAAIGKALSPRIPKYFNHMLLTQDTNGKKVIYTKNLSSNISLKSGAPLSVLQSYPQESGLADYFKAVLGN